MKLGPFRMVGQQWFALLLLLTSAFPQAKTSSNKAPLKTVEDIPLPGPAVRFDYQSLDPSSGTLYIAHMNADQLVIFDTATRKVTANIGGFTRVHAVWGGAGAAAPFRFGHGRSRSSRL